MFQHEPAVGAPIQKLLGMDTPPGAEVLASSSAVSRAIQTLAESVHAWASSGPVTLVALLEGGKYFADRLQAQLERSSSAPLARLDLKVSTREGDGRPLLDPTIRGDIESLHGRRVLVADDILDSGMTMALALKCLGGIVSEIKTAVLVQKDNPESNGKDNRPKVDFVGLTFTDTRWFSGAGMDMPGDSRGVARSASLIIAYPPVF